MSEDNRSWGGAPRGKCSSTVPHINAFYFPALLIAFSSSDLEKTSLLNFLWLWLLFGVRYVSSFFNNTPCQTQILKQQL